MTKKSDIFIVEDEVDICELVKENVEAAGFNVTAFNEGEYFFQHLNKKSKLPNLVILDIMLPGMDGLEICRKLRGEKSTSTIPIIMLTAKVEEIDRILGLELGADDYMTKPFSPRELVARIKAVLRRVDEYSKPSDKKEISIEVDKRLRIDLSKYKVLLDEKELKMTTTEFKLLCIMAENRGIVLSRRQILEKIWGDNRYVEDRTVDVHIRHLREKLQDKSKLIENIRGIGYKLTD